MCVRDKLEAVMSVEGNQHGEGSMGHLFDGSILSIAAASELTSPLVLMRQLGLAVGADGISDDERKLLGERLALTSERALGMASSLSMTTTDQQVFALEPVNPLSVCKEVIHELTPMFSAYDRKITLQSRTRTPLMVANRTILQRILLAFGDNALHYGSDEHPVQMAISGHGDRVRIGVRDYGPAVPIDMWKRLEGRVSRRALAPLSNRPQASGVGLLTAQRLAEMMDSVVGIVRHRDGATFYVDLRMSGQMSLL